MLKPAEIKKFIDADISSARKRFARVGDAYYNGDHDIKNYKIYYYDDNDNLVEDKQRSNVKISHPFFKEIAEQLPPYMLSTLENHIKAKKGMENSQELQKHLDVYFDDEFWAEISELILGAHNKGFEYIYGYINAENRLAFECADSLGVVEVEARVASDKQDHIIRSYIDRITTDNKVVKKIEDWTAEGTFYYVQINDGKIELDNETAINPRPHLVYTEKKTGKLKGRSFGYIPFWRMDNNQKQISALKPIKGLIDDYDLHSCALSNNLVDFDTPLYFVSGYPGDNLDRLQRNLRTKKIVAGDDGGIDVKTVDIPYQARKEKLEIDEKAIYRYGFALNTAGLKDSATTTNTLIKSAYSLLEIKATKMELNLRRLLKEIVKVVLDEINKANKTDYRLSDVEFDFPRNIMVNEQENAQIEKIKAETKQIETTTIMNIASTLDDETVVKNLCEVMDWDYEEIKDMISINANAYRDINRLREEYNKLANDGWFVAGTDYHAIIKHEIGHVVSNYYKVDCMELAKEIIGENSTTRILEYLRKNLSEYSSTYKDGSEIISECFASVYSSTKSNEFALKFLENYGNIILEKDKG